jgi:exopolysaccharide production protein ExoQ
MLGLLARAGSAAAALFILPWFLLAARSPGAALAKLAANAPFLALPLLAIVSVAWSQYPEVTLRAGFQFLLTSMIGVWAGTLIRPATFLSALLCALTAIAAASIAIDGGAGFRGEAAMQGVFDSKNMFAFYSVMLLITGICVLFDRRQHLLFRAIGAAALFLAPACLFAAQSTGAIIFSIPAIGVFFGVLTLARLPADLRRLAIGAVLAAAALAIVTVIIAGGDTGALLDSLGKDATLTGRTYLWQRAGDFIREAPLLGLGYQAFWQIGNPAAEELWAASFVESGAGFNFHNLYLHTTVELGYAGTAILVLTLLAIAGRLMVSLIARPCAPVYFAAALFTFFSSTSFIEVGLLYQFHLGTVLFGAIWTFSAAQTGSTYESALIPRKRKAMPVCRRHRKNHRCQPEAAATPMAAAAHTPALATDTQALAGAKDALDEAKTISA